MSDFDMAVFFLVFIAINSYFSFKAGENSGKFIGMISITQFFRDKQALKDKHKISGFENWPLPIQIIFTDPNPDNFEDE